MTHREIIELLPWYVNNTLAESERTRIAGHLDDCAACAQEVQTLRAMESHLISLDSEIGGLAPDASTFAHNLAGEPPPSLQEKVLRLFIPPGGFALDRGGLMPLAACLLLAIVGYQNFPGNSGAAATKDSVVAQVVSVTSLSGLERGSGQKIALDPASGYLLLKLDVNVEDENVANYAFYLKSEGEETFLTTSAAVAEVTLSLAHHLFVPDRDYELLVREHPESERAEPIESFKFQVVVAGL